MKCQNEDDPCENVATRYFGALRVCLKCFRRYQNHGDGKKMGPWENWRRKKSWRKAP